MHFFKKKSHGRFNSEMSLFSLFSLLTLRRNSNDALRVCRETEGTGGHDVRERVGCSRTGGEVLRFPFWHRVENGRPPLCNVNVTKTT